MSKEIIIKKYKTKKAYKNNSTGPDLKLPAYFSPIINFINGRMSGSQTAPKKVGQLTELFENYRNSLSESMIPNIEGWKKYYNNLSIKVGNKGKEEIKKGSKIIEDVIEKNIELKDKVIRILNSKEINKIIEKWVKDLMYNKTFNGLTIEPIIGLRSAEWISENDKEDFDKSLFRKSNAEEESKNIDYVYKNNYIQVKPHTYKNQKDGINNKLKDMVVAYYEIIKQDIKIIIEDKRKKENEK